MMDVKLRKPQMIRVMTERMRKLFGGGYWLGIVAPRGAVTSGCTGACMGVGWKLSPFCNYGFETFYEVEPSQRLDVIYCKQQ